MCFGNVILLIVQHLTQYTEAFNLIWIRDPCLGSDQRHNLTLDLLKI